MNHEHGGMEHGSHAGGGMGMPMQCSMNMLWNSQISGTCVVFESWQISTGWGMVVSCTAIVLISLFYSSLLHRMKLYDRRTALSIYQASNGALPGAHLSPPPPGRLSLHGLGEWDRLTGDDGSLTGRESPVSGKDAVRVGTVKLPRRVRTTRAVLYGVSVGISFFLMLVAMTYNTYLFASIIVGAILGHMLYEDEMDIGAVLSGNTGKGLACH